ncbi:MAG TPA: ATP-binding protein, partial [Longimicrobiaceae bacterium]|nr:ATP-binding protein [Longimicrobiaceae bacterium]
MLQAKAVGHADFLATVDTVIALTTPLLDAIIAGPFREYTLHNAGHARRVVHLMGELVADKTMQNLSLVEVGVLIVVAYLHDAGMTLSATDRAEIVGSPLLDDIIRGWPDLAHAIDETRKSLQQASDEKRFLLEAELYQLQEVALASYLRAMHATPTRYDQVIDQLQEFAGTRDLLQFRGVSLRETIVSICVSHNRDVGWLAESKGPYDQTFPRDVLIAGERLNAQFCAALLRLSDILDFDRERTPRSLFTNLGIATRTLPGAAVSLREWQKHLAIHTIELTDDEILIHADVAQPAIEHAIREFCAIIERELRDTMAVIKQNSASVLADYKLDLPLIVRPRIRSIGYTYKDLAFRLNQSAVLTLLMGERLYSEPAAAVRELIQNAVDATLARERVDLRYKASPVRVGTFIDSVGREWLEIEDEGIGMDDHVLAEYFFKIGSSYYDSAEFRRLVGTADVEFTPIARFGIGIMSVFMIGDLLEVETRNMFSPRGDIKRRVITVEGRSALAFVTEHDSGRQGTTIRLRLQSPPSQVFLHQVALYLRA